MFVAWEFFVDASNVRPAVLPAPSGVLSALWQNCELLLENAVPTTMETIAGFVLSVFFGGILGTLLTYFNYVRDAIYPNVIVFQLIQKWPSRRSSFCGLGSDGNRA